MITKEELQKLYVDENNTLATIGNMYGVTGWSVCRWLKKYGIMSNRNKVRKPYLDISEQRLRTLYLEYKNSLSTISKICGISIPSVVKLMLKYGIKTRTVSESHIGNVNRRAIIGDIIPTKDELQEWYVNEHLGTSTISKMYAISDGGIRYYLKKYGIPIRTLSESSPKIRPWHKGKKYRLGKHHSDETKDKLRKCHIGKPLPQSTRSKMSNSLLKNWQKPEYRDRTTKLAMLGNHIKPNKPEIFIQSLLDKMYPDEYEYTGDGKQIIGGKCPDFINNNKHKVILFHGIYWHLVKFQKTNPNLTKEQVEFRDISHYKKYGFSTLIVWEDELSDINSILSKIDTFHKILVVVGEKPIAICEAESASGVLPQNGGDYS